jgi:ubiquinone/menaquinone biosynthesis C-methylase UbiE
MKPALFLNGALTWLLGNTRDTAAMKDRVRKGYEGAVTDDIQRYDELGLEHYAKIARELLADVDVNGKEALDVGCGTGILSLLLLERGATSVVGGDISQSMLERCRIKAADAGYDVDRLELKELDSEGLPFGDDSFETVVSSMVLELVPNQRGTVAEMARVARPGGTIAVSTHGPEHYYELIDAAFAAMRIRDFMRFLGYRFETWQSEEAELRALLTETGLVDVQTKRLQWSEDFQDGGEAYDFFVGTSSGYWYDKFPEPARTALAKRTRSHFQRNGVTRCGIDVMLGWGRKPD